MIKMDGINKIYDIKGVRCTALDDINLEISINEFAVITGRSGCGKTTLLNMMGLMDEPDSGVYLFEGVDVNSLSLNQKSMTRNKKIGFIFQSFNLINDYTVYENIEMPLGYAGVDSVKRRERVAELLDYVGLKNKALNLPHQLSGGEQQRVAIARALANNPKIILADEPTGNLDTKNEKIMCDLLYDLILTGVTVIMVTHDHTNIRGGARVINMEDGKIL